MKRQFENIFDYENFNEICGRWLAAAQSYQNTALRYFQDLQNSLKAEIPESEKELIIDTLGIN